MGNNILNRLKASLKSHPWTRILSTADGRKSGAWFWSFCSGARYHPRDSSRRFRMIRMAKWVVQELSQLTNDRQQSSQNFRFGSETTEIERIWSKTRSRLCDSSCRKYGPLGPRAFPWFGALFLGIPFQYSFNYIFEFRNLNSNIASSCAENYPSILIEPKSQLLSGGGEVK